MRGKGQEVDITKPQVSAQCEDGLAATKGCYLPLSPEVLQQGLESQPQGFRRNLPMIR